MAVGRIPAAENPFGAANLVNRAEVTIGEEDSGAIPLTISLRDANNQALGQAAHVEGYFSSDADGATPVAVTLSPSEGLVFEQDDNLFKLVSNEDGELELEVEEASGGAGSYYLNLLLPDGSLVRSEEIEFE